MSLPIFIYLFIYLFVDLDTHHQTAWADACTPVRISVALHT